LLPPQLRDPQFAASLVSNGLIENLTGANGGAVLNQAQTAFVKSVGTEVSRFLSEGGRIALNVAPPESVWLNQDSVQDVAQLFADLQPLVDRSARRQQAILSPELLATALSEPDSLSDADRLAAGTALTTGIGAPRSVEQGRRLLQPLALAGNPEAAMQAAGSLQDNDPRGAYAFALTAAAGGAVQALGLLDRLEAKITTGDAISIQNNMLQRWRDKTIDEAVRTGDLRTLRGLALRYLTGNGAPRAYSRAYLLATLAAAAGDAGAIAMRDELDQRMRLRGEAAGAAWASTTAAAEKQAMDIWLQNGLAARFADQ